LAILMLGSVR